MRPGRHRLRVSAPDALLLGAVALWRHTALHHRAQRRRLELLVAASRRLARASDPEGAVEALLGDAVTAFGSRRGEVLLRDRRVIREADGTVHRERGGGRLVPSLLAAIPQGAALLEAPTGSDEVDAWLTAAGGAAVLAPLAGESATVGVLAIGAPPGRRRLTPADVELVDALAAAAGTALDLDRAGQAVDRLEAAQAQLHHQANHDALTGLANRAALLRELEAAIQQGGAAIVFLDLDEFKTVNDRLGHAAGDELLVAVAGRLRGVLRPHNLPARLGGDEFAVLVRDAEAAEAVAERVLAALDVPFAVAGGAVRVRASAGVAHSAAGEQPGDVLRRADLAMYAAKREARGGIARFRPALQERVEARSRLEAELAQAVGRRQLRLAYQPLVDLGTGAVTGAEALVRWDHPRRGLVQPAGFVPLGEETGLIRPLTGWVLDTALAAAAAWPAGTAVHVNVSWRDVLEEDFAPIVTAALERSGTVPDRLVLELSERRRPTGARDAGTALARLRRTGARLAADHFGAGAWSFTELRDRAFDIVKLDRAFLDGGRGETVLLPGLLDLAAGAGVDAIVEGVETPEQVERLRAAGARLAQGFALGPPVGESALWRCWPGAVRPADAGRTPRLPTAEAPESAPDTGSAGRSPGSR